jgi:hypothetical protein
MRKTCDEFLHFIECRFHHTLNLILIFYIPLTGTDHPVVKIERIDPNLTRRTHKGYFDWIV